MSWLSDAPEGAGAPEGTGMRGGSPSAPNAPQEGAQEPSGPSVDLTGKPEWMDARFWMPPEEDGGAADFASMAEKMHRSWAEATKKVSEQGSALAGYKVPDSMAPYHEGLDVQAMLDAAPRAGLTPEAAQRFLTLARSSNVGPQPAQAMLQAFVKGQHEATPEAKDAGTLRQEAEAALNAAGRPGTEMAKRVRTWAQGLQREGKLPDKQAEAMGRLMETPDGVELAHMLMGSMPSGPVGGESSTNVARSRIDAVLEKMGDDRFGDDPFFTAQVEREYNSLPKAALIAMGRGPVHAERVTTQGG